MIIVLHLEISLVKFTSLINDDSISITFSIFTKIIYFIFQEYSKKQLIALVSCACQNNKKTKQRLITMIEDLDRGLR